MEQAGKYSRRSFIGQSAAMAAAMSAVSAGNAFGSTSANRPNVLFLGFDDLSDWCGFLGGHPQALTPNIDKLASQGMAFTNAYCPAAVCNPSRSNFLCGTHPSTTGLYDNPQEMRANKILKSAITLPELFKNNGYATMGCGKIFHGHDPDKLSICDFPQSWNEYQANKCGCNPSGGTYSINRVDWGWCDTEDSNLGDYDAASWAADKLSQKYDQPFFLACGIIKPHLPWNVPKKYYDMHPLESIKLPYFLDDDWTDLGPVGASRTRSAEYTDIVKAGKFKEAVQAYLATCSFADAMMGRVLDALEKSAYRDNTIVVLWSDHGFMVGEKLRFSKVQVWRDAARTPMIFKVPGVTRAGSFCNKPVSLSDMYPTLAALCNVPLTSLPQSQKNAFTGNDLSPLLSDPNAQWPHYALTSYNQGNSCAVRSENWTYIKYKSGGEEELYHLRTDPHEFYNLINKSGEYIDIVSPSNGSSVNAKPVKVKWEKKSIDAVRQEHEAQLPSSWPAFDPPL